MLIGATNPNLIGILCQLNSSLQLPSTFLSWDEISWKQDEAFVPEQGKIIVNTWANVSQSIYKGKTELSIERRSEESRQNER